MSSFVVATPEAFAVASRELTSPRQRHRPPDPFTRNGVVLMWRAASRCTNPSMQSDNLPNTSDHF
jgi:hypothetical protein